MEYELTDAGVCRKKLSLTFSVEDIDKAFDESYREINNYVKLKGFRKGKAPRRTLEKRYAKEAADGVRQQLAETNVPDIVKKEDLHLLGEIASDSKGLAVPQPGKEYRTAFEFNVAPEFELPGYHGLDLPKHETNVTDAEVENELETLRKNFASYEPAPEGDGANVGDILGVGFETKVDGQEIMTMENQRLRVDGEILFGLPCPNLIEKFKGAKKGDFVVVKVTLPEEHPNPELRGREADVEVTVKSVEHGTMPEMTDEFAASIGIGTVEQLKQVLRTRLMRDGMIAAKQKEEDDIINMVIEKTSFDIPQNMVDAETNALVEQQRAQLLRAGVKAGDAMNTQMEKYRPEAAKEAARKVRWSILSQKIARKENLQVSNDDLAAHVEALAQSYGMPPAKVLQRIREYDGLAPMMAEILSIKVVQLIADSAKGKTDDTGSVNKAAADSAKEIGGGEGEGK